MEGLARKGKWVPLVLLLLAAGTLLHKESDDNHGATNQCSGQAQLQQSECYEHSWWWNLP